MPEPITLLIGALGGEGGGVLAQWLVDVARACSHAAQATSIPGVAQRTGATTYYLEFSPAPQRAGAPAPVFSLSPVPGGVDMLLCSEALEALRQAGLGFVDAQRTQVIASGERVLTTTEKMHGADGRVDMPALARTLQHHARVLHWLDFGALAREAGTIVSAPMLGALAASGVLPFPRAAYEVAIAAGGRGVAASQRGFALAFDRMAALQAAQQQVLQVLAPTAPTLATLATMREAGLARVRAFQDEAYAQCYLQRLARIESAEAAWGDAAQPIATETARALAVWMAFDDIARVAALKVHPERWQRVQRELKLAPGQVLKLYDHFKPGVPEVAGLLPAALARRMQAWDEGRQRRGHPAWSLPLKLPTHSVGGWWLLKLLAATRRLRPWGSRFAHEQARIDHWLVALERATREHPALGLEVALAARLVKGYGATHQRGQQRLTHLLNHLAFGPGDATQRAQALRAAREAALADDSGRALDRSLHSQGAPALPPREQPIRFVRRRAADVRSSPPL